MSQYIYVMKGMSKFYGTKEVLKDIWLSFLPGAKIGVIGHNGSGKSTLLKIMAGIDKEFNGEAWAADKVKIGYLEQEPKLDPNKNVFDNIVEAIKDKKNLIDEYNRITSKFSEEIDEEEMNDLIIKQGELQEKIDACDAWGLEREVEIAMNALRCPDGDSDISTLSGGEKRRIAICKLLLEKPDMLLLDEPTNHLDTESVAWLERYLKDYPGTVVMITHDRYFLDNVTSWILELDRGNGIPYSGNYSSWLEQKEKRLSVEEKSENERAKQLHRELEWIRQSPKARQAKSKARISSYENLLNQSREKTASITKIIIPEAPRLGDLVLEFNSISKSFGDKILIEDLSFVLPPGSIVGVIGPNGAGKTTLFKIITGKEHPTSGFLRVGESVKLGYIDQSRDHLDDNKSVWQEISDGLDELMFGKNMVKSRAYCASFNFKGSDQQKLVGNLSGGERNRVHMAKMLKEGANFILLDEPSNDLDIDTLRSLEEAIEEFSGCIMVTSHDRWFLDRIATHILSFEGEGRVEFYQGNYQEYEEYRNRKLGIDSTTPKKMKYKKIA